MVTFYQNTAKFKNFFHRSLTLRENKLEGFMYQPRARLSGACFSAPTLTVDYIRLG
jgi:hypothetical protein